MSDKISDERGAFESWYKVTYAFHGYEFELIKDRYLWENVQHMWVGWSSRAAEVKPVELPKKADASNLPFAAHGYNAAIDDCAKAIKAAGGTVKDE